MATKTKKSTPAIEIEEEETEEEQEQAAEPPSEYVTFKMSYFYAVLVVVAFAVGVMVGYVASGRSKTVTTMIPAAAAGPAAGTPQPTPLPTLYNIETKGYPAFGPENAPITIVEFSDYQCPYCYRWHVQVYDALLKAYPDKLRFVYRNFPLSFHQNAFAAAEAALCAGDQDAYWKMHDVLFDSQNLLNNQAGTVLAQSDWNKMATDLGLDVTTFEQCMTSGKYKASIDEDMKYTSTLAPDYEDGQMVSAVGGTPTFFINGHRLGGAYPIEYFKKIIDAELAKQ